MVKSPYVNITRLFNELVEYVDSCFETDKIRSSILNIKRESISQSLLLLKSWYQCIYNIKYTTTSQEEKEHTNNKTQPAS